MWCPKMKHYIIDNSQIILPNRTMRSMTNWFDVICMVLIQLIWIYIYICINNFFRYIVLTSIMTNSNMTHRNPSVMVMFCFFPERCSSLLMCCYLQKYLYYCFHVKQQHNNTLESSLYWPVIIRKCHIFIVSLHMILLLNTVYVMCEYQHILCRSTWVTNDANDLFL